MGTKREVYGRLVQCRTGHAFIGEYYAKFVPLERVDCQCGDAFQTREHLLRECGTYEEHRGILRETSAQLSLPDILGTEKGIRALSGFLEKSGAVTKTGRLRRETEPLTLEEDEELDDEEESEDGYGGMKKAGRRVTG
ncbi:hypothetical protein C8J57DRAFT_91139 [Mycena rebaudengoi]|nr:hypothetical protein C8J57DRAFT_91139 [Mycena rebaudengoi]